MGTYGPLTTHVKDKKAVIHKTHAARVSTHADRVLNIRKTHAVRAQHGRTAMEIDSGAGYREALARKAQRELNARYARRA